MLISFYVHVTDNKDSEVLDTDHKRSLVRSLVTNQWLIPPSDIGSLIKSHYGWPVDYNVNGVLLLHTLVSK